MDSRYLILGKKLDALSKSKFRSSFKLRGYMIPFIEEKGFNVIKSHAESFIESKLVPAFIPNDGKQTPTKNHPVFIAMHACACCCRGCLEKWHNIPKGRELTVYEKNYIISLLMLWIKREYQNRQ